MGEMIFLLVFYEKVIQYNKTLRYYKLYYHEMFDEALQRYNDKQTRNDRKIDNYYEKIRMSKQEKLFHELIIQIGNKDDMASDSYSLPLKT